MCRRIVKFRRMNPMILPNFVRNRQVATELSRISVLAAAMKLITVMEKRYFLAVDLGATSGRTIVASYDGARVTMDELTRFGNSMIPCRGHLFWDIAALYNEILLALRKAAVAGIRLSSIGIDTWGCDFALFGRDGQLLSLPYCYRDSHTDGASGRFFRKMPKEELYGKTGIQFMDFNSLFQLDTLKKQSCPALDAADKILFMPDALIYMLTGRQVCEYTVASTSQMLNVRTRDFDPEILAALGIGREKFGKIVFPGSVAGRLSEQVVQETGMDAVVVAVAGHDTASAVAAIPASRKGYAYLSCGTWSLLGIETGDAIVDESSFRENFTNEGGVEGTVRFLKNICGLWIFEQCRKEFRDAPADVGGLASLCEDTDFGSLIDPDAHCFSHPVSMTGAICGYCRATGQIPPQTPAEYVRCIFRSLAMRYRQVLGVLQKMAPEKIDTLHVIGGGSLNAHLMQYTANAAGIAVIAGPSECTALGNVLLQLKAAGLADGLERMRQISRASVTVKEYLPQDQEEWDMEYSRFLDIQDIYCRIRNDGDCTENVKG